jgi:membrane protein required for colicin V production
MNGIDLVLVIILAMFILLGFRKGLLKEVIGFIGLVVAFWTAMRFTKAAAGLFPKLSIPAREALTFLVILVGVFLLFHLAGFLLRKLIKASPLAILDRLGGVALGLLKGGLLLSICLLVLTLAPLPKPWAEKVEGSLAAQGVRQVAPMAYEATKVIGPGLRSLYERFMTQAREPVGAQVEQIKKMVGEAQAKPLDSSAVKRSDSLKAKR